MSTIRNVVWNEVIQVLCSISSTFKDIISWLNQKKQPYISPIERSLRQCPSAPRIAPMRGHLEDVPLLVLSPSLLDEYSFKLDETSVLSLD